MRPSIQDSLRKSPVFLALSDDSLLRLLPHGLRRKVPPGTTLFQEGEPCREISMLLQGSVRLWKQNERGQLIVLHRCKPGDILGQMSMLDQSPHSVSATTDDECEIWNVQSSAFREILQDNPDALMRLAILLSERVRDLSQELEDLKFLTVQERLSRKLRELGAERREIKLTHESIAQEIGATRENVSRALAAFSEKGAIALHRGAIEIIDLSLLP